jgi:hypothetical protein
MVKVLIFLSEFFTKILEGSGNALSRAKHNRIDVYDFLAKAIQLE